MEGTTGRTGRPRGGVAAFVAGCMVLAIVVLYAAIIVSQDDVTQPGRSVFVVLFLVAAALGCFAGASARVPDDVRLLALIAAASALWSAGLVSLLSIGILLLGAAVAATVATSRASRKGMRLPPARVVLAVVLPPLLLIAGLAIG